MSLNHIDAHTHLNFEPFDEDRKATISEMKEQGVGAVNVGIDEKTSRESIGLAEKHKHIWASVGCHPTEVPTDLATEIYREMAQSSSQVVAIGECGLDYYRKKHRGETVKETQKHAFEAQVELALKLELPLILHLRPRENTMDAYEDGLDILEYYANQTSTKLRGTVHFFVGSQEIAKRFLDLGFYISFTGPLTFDERLQNVCADVPTDRLIAETDAPFAAPEPHRGQRNSPIYVPEITKAIADCKKDNLDSFRSTITANTATCFNLESER